MALSNEEQRTLDEIERALRDDNPKYVNAVSVDHPGATGRAWRVRVPTNCPIPRGTNEQRVDGLVMTWTCWSFPARWPAWSLLPGSRIPQPRLQPPRSVAVPARVSDGKWTGDHPNGMG